MNETFGSKNMWKLWYEDTIPWNFVSAKPDHVYYLEQTWE